MKVTSFKTVEEFHPALGVIDQNVTIAASIANILLQALVIFLTILKPIIAANQELYVTFVICSFQA